MTSLFVTSSGTDIGKTHVCCGLLSSLPADLRVRCIKPIVTGFDPEAADASDTGRLLTAQGLPVDAAGIAATSPWRFRAALSADMAAARERTAVPFDELVAFSRAPPDCALNLIEGIGGVMAPIDSRHTVLDWIEAVDTRALLVVGSYLGTLSHTLTALHALTSRGVDLVAIVVSQSVEEPVPTAETAACLERFSGGVPVAVLPRDANADFAPLAALIGRR
jgi:dethiobiotin synthetase